MPQIQIFWSLRLASGRLARSPGLYSFRLYGSLRFFGQFHWQLRNLNCCRNRRGRGRGRDMCSRRFRLSWSSGGFRCGNGRCCGRRRRGCWGWCSNGGFRLCLWNDCFGCGSGWFRRRHCNMFFGCRFRSSGFLLQANEVEVKGVEINKSRTTQYDQDTNEYPDFLSRHDAHVFPFPSKSHRSINHRPNRHISRFTPTR